MIEAFALILVLQLAGEAIVQALGLPLPGPLVGMLLLFAGLVWRGEVPDGLKETAAALHRHLMLLFIPAVAGVMMLFDRSGREWLALLVGGIGGAAITLVVTALTLRWMLRRSGGEPGADADRDDR